MVDGSEPPAGDADETLQVRGRRRAGQALACGWCGTAFTVARVGRTPKWCSDSCRQRAWRRARSAAADAVAVRVVDRVVEVEVPVPVVERVEVAVSPRGAQWPPVLRDLARQLDSGRVYDRDLAELEVALREVLGALSRRRATRR